MAKLSIILLFLFVAGACNVFQGNELATQEALALDTSIAETVSAVVDARAATQTVAQLSASPTASRTPTLTASNTPSPTPEGPIAILQEKAECRLGPGDHYPGVDTLKAGWILSVLHASVKGDFYVVALPLTDDVCWLEKGMLDFQGKGEILPIATAPSTPTPSLTPTPNIVWRGEWAIWVGPAPLTQYLMTLNHEGFDISGSFDAGAGNIVTLSGTLDESYSMVTGIWASSIGGSGTFEWKRKSNPNQFVGNIYGGADEWCGAIAGASLPSPCFGP